MQLSDVVSINLSIANPINLQTGFQTGLITGFSNRLASDVPVAFITGITSQANGLASLAALGFLTSDPEYLAATSYLAQTPTPTSMAVGKRNTKVAQISTLTVNTATVGHVYTASLYGQVATYTAIGGDTTTTIAAALVTALEALTVPAYSAATIANSSAVITITATNAGVNLNFSNSDALMTGATGTPAVGLFQDLATIVGYSSGTGTNAISGNNFVMFSNTGENDVDIWAGNSFALANQKIQIAKNDESGCLNGTDMVYNAINALGSVSGTMMNYFGAANGYAQYADAALMGLYVTQNPGSFSTNLKTLSGITPDGSISETQITALKTANINFYTTMGTQPFFINGKMSDGNPVDVYYGLYAFNQQVQVAILTAMSALPKFPYNDAGLTIISDAINQVAALFAGPAYNFFSPNPTTGITYTITMPTLISVSQASRKAGTLTGIVFNGYLAADVLQATITGQVYY